MKFSLYQNLISTVGCTPLVCIENFSKLVGAEVLAKCEFLNPAFSVKDRIGKAMIEDAESKGLLSRDSTIIESTSGNTGIALAFVCAAKKYRLKLVMPNTMSIERRALLLLLGAEVILTPGEKGMAGAVKKAEEIAAREPKSFMPQQFDNLANVDIHRRTTFYEIFEACDGKLDYFVAGVGTGGTITGVGEMLKEKSPRTRIIAVEPKDSPVLSGGKAGAHKIQGIGAGFIPSILNRDVIHEVIQVRNEDAFEKSRMVARIDGVLVGISSGAALDAVSQLASRPEIKHKRIVVILPSPAERYLSTLLFKDVLEKAKKLPTIPAHVK